MLSKSWGYAVRAFVLLGQTHDDQKRRWSSDELAEAAALPPSFLAKVLQELTSQGLLTSSRGRGGGVRLSRDPKEIRLSDIAAVTEDLSPFDIGGAGLEDAAEEIITNLARRWRPYARGVNEFLVETTIADLLPDRPIEQTMDGEKR